MPREFNADEKAKEATLRVTIGGKVFLAEEPTLATMKKVAERVPKGKRDEDDPDALEKDIDSVFPQLEVLLKGEDDGKPPTKKHVEEHLTMRRAGELIRELMGSPEAEGNPQ